MRGYYFSPRCGQDGGGGGVAPSALFGDGDTLAGSFVRSFGYLLARHNDSPELGLYVSFFFFLNCGYRLKGSYLLRDPN